MLGTTEDRQAVFGAEESGVLGQQANSAGALASPSLSGAESMACELNLDSPHFTNSKRSENEPRTPDEPDATTHRSRSQPNGQSTRSENDITPKQPQRATFSRQINIPIPPSFYYDPDDPTTHNLEYATRKSGRKYMRSGDSTELTDDGGLPTLGCSATEYEDEIEIGLSRTADKIPVHLSARFVKPLPRLGKLVSTQDSFRPITLNLCSKISSWGRAPSNTHPYREIHDTRIPKRGIIIWYFAKDIDNPKIKDDDRAWTKLPDLHCLVSTESSLGIYINGVLLKKSEPDEPGRGRIYTGDEITVLKGRDGAGALRFIAEFYHGEAKEIRPVGSPRFQLETITGFKPRLQQNERLKESSLSPGPVAIA